MITNKSKLESPFIQQAELRELEPKRMWVTQLIDAPLIRQLRIKHHKDLAIDAEECITALTGSGGHNVLERAGKRKGNCIVEQKWVDKFSDWEVVGITDLWEDGIITDYKFCKVWKYIYKDTKNWEAQLNVNALQWQKQGIRVVEIQVRAVFVDWMQGKAKGSDNYPPKRHYLFKLNLWSNDQVLDYIYQRLKLHSEPAQECTPEEKWEKPTTYAVMKKGRKSALRVLKNYEEAWEWCLQNGHTCQKPYDDHMQKEALSNGISIITRPGECTRCLNYCPVRSVCPYQNGEKNENPNA